VGQAAIPTNFPGYQLIAFHYFLKLLGKHRQHLKKIAHDAEIRFFKDRRFRVFIDRHDNLGSLHPGKMLDRSGNPAGDIKYRIVEESEDVPNAMDVFLRLFRQSSGNKATFMTDQRESFFRAVARAMAQTSFLRLCILELNASPVAAVMCFDYNNRVYLYNSSYDPQYAPLSVGLISKILSIKESIERGRRTFDFLKGGEDYKYRLGGKEIPLHSCHIALG